MYFSKKEKILRNGGLSHHTSAHLVKDKGEMNLMCCAEADSRGLYISAVTLDRGGGRSFKCQAYNLTAGVVCKGLHQDLIQFQASDASS